MTQTQPATWFGFLLSTLVDTKGALHNPYGNRRLEARQLSPIGKRLTGVGCRGSHKRRSIRHPSHCQHQRLLADGRYVLVSRDTSLDDVHAATDGEHWKAQPRGQGLSARNEDLGLVGQGRRAGDLGDLGDMSNNDARMELPLGDGASFQSLALIVSVMNCVMCACRCGAHRERSRSPSPTPQLRCPSLRKASFSSG